MVCEDHDDAGPGKGRAQGSKFTVLVFYRQDSIKKLTCLQAHLPLLCKIFVLSVQSVIGPLWEKASSVGNAICSKMPLPMKNAITLFYVYIRGMPSIKAIVVN